MSNRPATDATLLDTARALLRLFTGRERWLLLIVLGLSIAAAVVETLSVAAIFPFMTVVIDPAAVDRWTPVRRLLTWAGVTTPGETVVVLGVLTIVVLVGGNTVAAWNIWAQERFAARAKTRLTTRLFSAYLNQPYAFHVQHDAPSLIKIVTVDALVMVNGVIAPTLVVVSRGFVSLGILVLLFTQQPAVALSVGAGLGAAYGLVFLWT